MARVSEKEIKDIISVLEVEVANTPVGKNKQRVELAGEIIKKLYKTFVTTTDATEKKTTKKASKRKK